ncbi:MAG: HD domain-containing protein [Elusimicrobiota bacterium]
MPDLLKELLKEKKEIYLVGGALRDYLLKRPIKDLDFVISASSDSCGKYAKKLAKKIKASVFPLDIQRGVWRLSVDSGLNLDFSPLQDNIKKDLLSRDFTINALGLELKGISKLSWDKKSFQIKPVKKCLIKDFSSGIKDLTNRRVRAVDEKAFEEDPLRMLRAFRFCSVLGFNLDSKTLMSIKKLSSRIKESSPERIREELLQTLSSPESHKAFQLMKKTGILFHIFPQLKEQEKCAEIYYGNGGVLKHTLAVLERMDLFFSKPEKYMPSYKGFGLSKEKIVLLKLSALLHDIAKPATAREIDGRLRFFGHEEKGARMSYTILRELKFSNEEIRYISRIIGQHLRIGNIAHSEIISQKAMLKIFSDLGETACGLIILSWADHASYISKKRLVSSVSEMKKKPFKIPPKGLPRTGFRKTLRFIQVVNLLASNYVKKKKDLNLKTLLDGHEIMKLLSLNPGPQVGEALRRLRFMQFEGKIKNRKDAERYLKTLKL